MSTSPSDTFTAMYVQIVEEMQTLLDLLQMDSPEEAQAPVAMELAISARSFAALAQRFAFSCRQEDHDNSLSITPMSTSRQHGNKPMICKRLKALTKRPVRGKHALLRRIRTNTLSEWGSFAGS